MPADLVLPSETRHVFRPRRLADLDLWLKLCSLFLLASCYCGGLGVLQRLSAAFSAEHLHLLPLRLRGGLCPGLSGHAIGAHLLWWRYRPFPLLPGPLPKVTVIIPAYNEGAMVEKAIYSVAASDYPADRLEIFCIDDGSKDDTWKYMQRAQSRCPELIRLIRFPENRGKREALYAGFTQGTGEYFVSVDSDSVIEPATLKQIVAPLLQDPKVGGVAGNVKVYNRSVNLITRMLWVRFVLAFDFLRACQSGYRFVFCTPGALSAYRREAILPILEEWRHQTFLGAHCTIGEDRAFTNLILRQGYDTVYQRSPPWFTPRSPRPTRACAVCFCAGTGQISGSPTSRWPSCSPATGRSTGCCPFDFFIRELEFPLSCIFIPLLLVVHRHLRPWSW